MRSEIPRVYADTSVFGGPFDDEFAEPSRVFFEQVRLGRFMLVTSALVRAELDPAPGAVRELFQNILAFATVVEPTSDALSLRQAYLDAKIVPAASLDDALHVALATVSGCNIIVSWNFKHIVHFQKIPLYNAVNALRRYPGVAIFAPHEVIEYEDQDV